MSFVAWFLEVAVLLVVGAPFQVLSVGLELFKIIVYT